MIVEIDSAIACAGVARPSATYLLLAVAWAVRAAYR